MSAFRRRVPTADKQGGVPGGAPSPSRVLATSGLTPSPGTKPSIHVPGHILTSTGVPSLDEVLGGGLLLGSVSVLEEDYPTGYAKHLLKYWVAEGAAQGHRTLWISAERGVEMLEGLPAWKEVPNEASPTSASSPTGKAPAPPAGPGKMKIAWRYEHLPQLDKSTPSPRMGVLLLN
jgi:elongator complex protein 4